MDEATQVARKLSALVDMGFERVDTSPVTTETTRIDRKTYKVRSARAAMGTLVSVTALSRSEQRAHDAIGGAFEEMERLIRVFSRYDSASAISHLNDAGRLDAAPPEFSHVLSHSLQYHALTDGVFDVSVAPVVDLFRRSTAGALPAQRDVREALALVGAQNITLSPGRVRFERTGMGLTLDGIAKGYIVDAIAHALERGGVEDYLIDGGGDVRARGEKEGHVAWTVAVQDPSKQGRFPDVIQLSNSAVATSGGYEVSFDSAGKHHHIIDAETGESPTSSQSVSVIAPTTMAADALATAAFLMSPDDGVEFIGRLSGCECLIVDRDGLQLKTRGWQSAAPVH